MKFLRNACNYTTLKSKSLFTVISLPYYHSLNMRYDYNFSYGNCTNIGEFEPYTGNWYMYKTNEFDIGKRVSLNRKCKQIETLPLRRRKIF